MGTVNINLAEAQNLNLPLGLQLENEVTEVVFDFSAWQTAYGSGDLGLSIQRPGDSQPYAGELTIDGTDATWTVSSLDIAYKGVGEIQLTYTVGTVVKKSVIYKFTVYKSLGANGEYPSPGQTWQEEMEEEIADVKQDLAHITSSAVPTTVRQAIKTLFETGGYADTGLTDEMAVISSWASQVTGITLNQSSISISGATTSQLVATTTPAGGTVTWSSSDTSVATVSSNGLVTGVGNGTVTITATSGDVSATCTATVSGFATLTSISAVYTQSGTVYDTDTLDSLKDDLVVTAYYDDTTTATVPSADYTLSGTLEVGTSTIVVSYGGKTTTFNVTVQASVITVEVEGPNTTLNESATIGTSYENCKKYNEDRYIPVNAIPVSVGDVISFSASNISTNTLGIYLLWFDADQNYTGVHSSSWDTTGSYIVDQSYPYLGFAISTRPTQTAIRTATDIAITVQRN